MNQSTSTSEIIVSCSHIKDEDDEDGGDPGGGGDDDQHPCSIGTPVCLPAVVWLEDDQGELIFTHCSRNIIRLKD